MSDKILKLSQAQTLYQDLRERIDALPTSEDIPEAPVQDVQVNGTSILQNGVANVPIAGINVLGAVKKVDAARDGININADGTLCTYPATSAMIKSGGALYQPVTTQRQHESVFYGLAKAAGDSTQSVSTNAVGTYTNEAKEAIQQMLDVPSTADLAAKLDAAEAGLKVVRLI